MTHGHHQDGCLMCAVRALTSGTPQAWVPIVGEWVSGVVLARGRTVSQFASSPADTVPYLDLWLGDMDRIRVIGFGVVLTDLIEREDPQVGDTVTVTYLGSALVQAGKNVGKEYKKYNLEVRRGH